MPQGTTAAAGRRRVLVIANPIAGAGRGERLARELARELEAAGAATELRLTAARGDARRFAAEAEADVVVSVGGDGTLNEVLRGHRDPAVPIGILPLGTANVLALDLGLESDPRRAAETVLGDRSVVLDTALVDGELSFLAVGVGFDAEAVREVEARRRGPISKLTYVRAGLAALARQREPALQIEVDGESVPGTFGWVVASNVIRFGGVFRLAPDRVLGDGLWEFYLFERAARRHLLVHLLRLLFGCVPTDDGPAAEESASPPPRGIGHTRCVPQASPWGVRRLRARRAVIRSANEVAVQIDGDLRGKLPLTLEVAGPRFTILCPRGARRP